MKNLIFLFLAFAAPIITIGQIAQTEYLEAKRLFNNGQYTSAKGAFGSLTEDPDLGVYASFYYALSAYNQGDFNSAFDMWNQLLVKNPKWEKKGEILFWLAYANLEREQFDKGINYAAELTAYTNDDQSEKELFGKFIQPLGLAKVKSIYDRNTENQFLALTYLQKLQMQSYENRDFKLIDELNKKWSLEAQDYAFSTRPKVLRDNYRIGVALPFMYDENNLEWSVRNTLVMDMYQGMRLAESELQSSGIQISLVPIDTKKDEEVTIKALESLNNSPVDLIIGPLYPKPLSAVQEYSFSNQINMINPLSSNSQIISENPYAFLFKPTYETTARALARKASKDFSNKNAMIFYENNARDSLFAAIYKQEIEAYGFNVVWYQELTKENAKSVLDTLIDQYEVFYTKEEADSIIEIPQRYVKERRVRMDELNRIKKFKEGKTPWDSLFYLPVTINDEGKETTYYEKFLYIKQDSLGHILGATRKNFIANNLISAVETMGDSTVIYGFGEWLDFTMVSLDQLERINVEMIDMDFVETSSAPYRDFRKKITEKYAILPSKYHLIGYELVMQVGTLLDQYGVYFQNQLRKGEYYSGFVGEGLRYGAENDNQIVPIIKFENAELKVVNRALYED